MDDGDGGHGAVIDDADVLDELAELEGQVRGEGGSAAHSRRGSTSHANGRGSELDEGALLAEAEAEADQLAEEEEAAARKQQLQQQQQQQKQQQQQQQPQQPQSQKPAPPPRSQQQQVTASASTLTAPAPSAADAAAAASPAAEIASLTAQLQDLKRKAVEFKQAGNQPQAIEVLRNYKTVQARITELTKQASVPAPPAAAAPAKPAATPVNAAPAVAAAKPAVPSRPTPAAAAAAVAAVSSAATAVPSSARPTVPVSAAPSSSSSSSSSSGPKLSVRDNLEYDDLVSKLDAQIASLTASMKAVVEGTGGSGGAVVAGSKNAKLLALQYFRAKTRSTKDRDLVLLARSRLLRPPQTHLEELAVQQELCFPDLGDDEISVVVERGTDLHNRAATGDPKDLSTYVSMFVEYAVDMEGNYRAAGAHSTPLAKQKGSSPNWAHTQRIPLPISRAGNKQDKTGLKRLLRSRLVFQVYHKRFLLGSIEVGRAEVRLKELSLRSELSLALKLKDAKTAERTGELHVVVRLRRPFEGIDLRENKLSLIIVDEFEDGAAAAAAAPTHAHAPAPAAAHTPAPPAVAAAAVAASPAVSASAPPVAAAPSSSAGVAAAVGVPAVDLSDPHDVVKMHSNDVLEAEVAMLQTQLAQLAAHPDRAEEADALRDRLTAAQVQLQVLVTQVQHGKLSLEEYLAGLRSSIASESALAIALGRAARKEDAIRVLQRVKIMKAELQNAEENQEELEQC